MNKVGRRRSLGGRRQSRQSTCLDHWSMAHRARMWQAIAPRRASGTPWVPGNAASTNFFRRSVRPGRPGRGGCDRRARPVAGRLSGVGGITPGRRTAEGCGGRPDVYINFLKSYTPPKKVRARAVSCHPAAFSTVSPAHRRTGTPNRGRTPTTNRKKGAPPGNGWRALRQAYR